MRNNLLINDPFSIERHEYLTAIEQSKRDYDNIMRQKEAELVKDYGTLMESALETAGVSLTSGPSNAYKGEFSVSRKY
ncbi:hypothetical protein G9A89_013289 [Geosiphon pyriformis]|nr:hypothetical protein G9A89_013289 [Geosiphon pyriformis]